MSSDIIKKRKSFNFTPLSYLYKLIIYNRQLIGNNN